MSKLPKIHSLDLDESVDISLKYLQDVWPLLGAFGRTGPIGVTYKNMQAQLSGLSQYLSVW